MCLYMIKVTKGCEVWHFSKSGNVSMLDSGMRVLDQ